LSVRTLRGLLKRLVDPLPCFKLDGKILVKQTEFDAWMARRRVNTHEQTRVSDIVDDVMEGFR